jgi:hypothetical protein
MSPYKKPKSNSKPVSESKPAKGQKTRKQGEKESGKAEIKKCGTPGEQSKKKLKVSVQGAIDERELAIVLEGWLDTPIGELINALVTRAKLSVSQAWYAIECIGCEQKEEAQEREA